jgi:hypothetical protein
MSPTAEFPSFRKEFGCQPAHEPHIASHPIPSSRRERRRQEESGNGKPAAALQINTLRLRPLPPTNQRQRRARRRLLPAEAPGQGPIFHPVRPARGELASPANPPVAVGGFSTRAIRYVRGPEIWGGSITCGAAISLARVPWGSFGLFLPPAFLGSIRSNERHVVSAGWDGGWIGLA